MASQTEGGRPEGEAGALDSRHGALSLERPEAGSGGACQDVEQRTASGPLARQKGQERGLPRLAVAEPWACRSGGRVFYIRTSILPFEMRKEGGAKRQDGNSIPTAFSLHQDTPRYPALPPCAMICPLWGLFIQVISSLASFP